MAAWSSHARARDAGIRRSRGPVALGVRGARCCAKLGGRHSPALWICPLRCLHVAARLAACSARDPAPPVGATSSRRAHRRGSGCTCALEAAGAVESARGRDSAAPIPALDRPTCRASAARLRRQARGRGLRLVGAASRSAEAPHLAALRLDPADSLDPRAVTQCGASSCGRWLFSEPVIALERRPYSPRSRPGESIGSSRWRDIGGWNVALRSAARTFGRASGRAPKRWLEALCGSQRR